MERLCTAQYDLVVDPDGGGLVCAFRFRQGEDWTDVFSPEPAGAGFLDRLPLFGCFPMVPFANRLSEPFLPLGPDRAFFERNWPAENLAMHGVGYLRRWIVDGRSADWISMKTEIEEAGGMKLGTATQTVRLSDTDGLMMCLGYCHEHEMSMPAGVGLHPWFSAPEGEGGTQLRFEASGYFEMGPDQFPTGHRHFECGEETVLGFDRDGLDTCFTGWGGTAILQRPEKRLEARITSDACLLHCFVSSAFEAICVEPVTHTPNAAHDHRWQDISALPLLHSGQETAVTIQVSLCALS